MSSQVEAITSAYTAIQLERARESMDLHKWDTLVSSANRETTSVIRQLKGLQNIMSIYDTIDPDIVLEQLDLAKVFPDNDNNSSDDYTETQLRNLMRYFKNDFFLWMNSPTCEVCGSAETQSIGAVQEPFEGKWKTETCLVEVYKCRLGHTTKFPRLNHPLNLLFSKTGRCGEWVNCFLMIAKCVVGGDFRYLWNAEDHVWCEYYNVSQQRWIHLDPCEAVMDEPLLYSENWGKAMSLVVASGEDYMVDVSSKYITKNRINKPEVSTKKIHQCIHLLNQNKLLQRLTQTDIPYLYMHALVRKNKELQLLRSGTLLENQQLSTPSATDIPKGRQSGSAEWTKQRGEDGGS